MLAQCYGDTNQEWKFQNTSHLRSVPCLLSNIFVLIFYSQKILHQYLSTLKLVNIDTIVCFEAHEVILPLDSKPSVDIKWESQENSTRSSQYIATLFIP